ncbi:hypothetical protein Z965_05175 [Clostridium novyi A str. BKT29909]|uniref:hypothetical protein n=1 Tax=Clostridium novyi TaxID=1542 RepID=UPI0004D4C756|nr:hypothetical protein [Clostridium novyi]KEH87958.1 hypothetical protein Z965_05175 [Clostridium novyi A str. BKT29909]
MEYPYNKIIFNKKCENHKFITYELSYLQSKEEYLQYIIPILREEYGIGTQIEKKLSKLSPKSQEKMRRLLAKRSVPDPNIQAPKDKDQLKNTRSKIAEAIAKDILSKKDNVEFSAITCLEEEDADMPKRGVDNFGFIFKQSKGDISLEKIVACEVKASDSSKSPPNVVHSNKDSMYSELLRLSNFDERLQKAIASYFHRLDDEKYCELIADILLKIEENEDLSNLKSKLLVIPFLLRTKKTYSEKDFGKFITNYSEFSDASIKYYIIVIDSELNTFADEIYRKVRGEA